MNSWKSLSTKSPPKEARAPSYNTFLRNFAQSQKKKKSKRTKDPNDDNNNNNNNPEIYEIYQHLTHVCVCKHLMLVRNAQTISGQFFIKKIIIRKTAKEK